MRNTYISDDILDTTAKAIAAQEPCPVSGRLEPYQILQLLGIHAGIWPASIMDDVVRAAIADYEQNAT
ncbi:MULTISPECIES: hypothetical protein [Afipia]|uniref:hypothetical protein n=1 Tax=Afipia TaxID=1033 RepID=UPI0011C02519|nr:MULTISPECIES: hypothetical protein [Afipia]